MKLKFYEVTTCFFDDGKVTAAITRTIETGQKPDDSRSSNDKCDVYKDWFETEKAANQFIKDTEEA